MDRHWLPAILLGASIVLALVFAVILSPEGHDLVNPPQPVREVIAPTTPVSEDTYRTAVNALLAAYAETNDAEATYNALIALRVPASDLNVHYELVIAMGKAMGGYRDDAAARFAALKAQYSWLAL